MKPLFTEADCYLSHFLESSQRASMSVAKANCLFQGWLAKGTVVYGRIDGDHGWFNGVGVHTQIAGEYGRSTHKALLINIEPIEVPDSAEKLLTEMASHQSLNFQSWSDFMVRARKLTQNKGGGK